MRAQIIGLQHVMAIFRLPVTILFFLLLAADVRANKLLIPMAATGQTNHLKAYGVAYAGIEQQAGVEWLLNYEGGSFVMSYSSALAQLCKERNVTCWQITDEQYADIAKQLTDTGFNGNIVKLEKVPRIAVYTPVNKRPWDDAVTLALTYAQIPFDKVYADEVLSGYLERYDWLHLHHEDFTGMMGKPHTRTVADSIWLSNEVKTMTAMAKRHGYKKISQLELAVVQTIRAFVDNGGNLFAMCSATETFDIALAAKNTDICDSVYDGDAVAPDFSSRLDFSDCLALQNFSIDPWPENSHATTNVSFFHGSLPLDTAHFTLASPEAKLDIIPAMLCQNHTRQIKAFKGWTTYFDERFIKPEVMLLGRYRFTMVRTANYIHGNLGKGTWTFYGGHDPEAFVLKTNTLPTDLSMYPNSAGYRLILNNMLFPAAERVDMPTVVSSSNAEKKTDTAAAAKAPVNKIRMNASANELLISADAGKIRRVSIFDITGEKMTDMYLDTQVATVDIQDLPSGTYFVRVNGKYAGKLVKVIK